MDNIFFRKNFRDRIIFRNNLHVVRLRAGSAGSAFEEHAGEESAEFIDRVDNHNGYKKPADRDGSLGRNLSCF